MNETIFHGKLDSNSIYEIPDVHLRETRAFARAHAHDKSDFFFFVCHENFLFFIGY